jgi:hypothetical protein
MERKKIYIWIGVGVIVAAVIIFLGLNGSLFSFLNSSPSNVSTGTNSTDVPASGANSVVRGTSPISQNGQVVTAGNKPVDLNVAPGAPDAPKAAAHLSQSDIPASAVKITMAMGGITPNRFTVNSGAVVTLAITSADKYSHLLKFESPSLSAVAVGLDPGETRAINFNAPAKGDYVFYCDVPSHRNKGEAGVMTVR